MSEKKRRVHFIGIGGIGVSGIAHLALERGEAVAGSDVRESAITRRLASLGAQVAVGHDARHVQGADLVVYSSAIRPDNPELQAARAAGIPVLRRAEFLCELMSDKRVITVAGAHGKTTTSSLAAKLLLHAGLEPTIAVGGILREDGDNAKFGQSPYFVAEADESDGSFLCYTPTYSIVTNIDEEHLDFYKTREALLSAFAVFLRRTKPEGCVFFWEADAVLKELVVACGVRAQSFGLAPGADYYPRDMDLAGSHIAFVCWRRDKELGRVSVPLRGRHNVLNALAVIALGVELGIDFDKIAEALGSFKGVERRFQVKYEDERTMVVDDYGHHPTEIRATLEAAKRCSRRRLVVVFQPHRFSRTHLLWESFCGSFGDSDVLLLTDIYPAGEPPLEGVSAVLLAEEIQRRTGRPAAYVAKDAIVRELKKITEPGDLVLFLGAGDITRISDEFAQMARASSQG